MGSARIIRRWLLAVGHRLGYAMWMWTDDYMDDDQKRCA